MSSALLRSNVVHLLYVLTLSSIRNKDKMSIKQRDEDKTPKRQSQIHNQTHRQTEAWTNREKPKHKQTDIQMKRNTGD